MTHSLSRAADSQLTWGCFTGTVTGPARILGAPVPPGAPANTPLHRCDDCQHHLGDALRAFCRCPMWGKPRWNLELRCAAFEPKSSVRIPSRP
jgi:hypothetical protein